MQKQYYLYDESGFYTEPIIVDINDLSDDLRQQVDDSINEIYRNSQIPDNATAIMPPSGYNIGYKMRFNPQSQKWEEAATQDEINQILSVNRTQIPSDTERINAVENMLLAIVFGGGINADS